MSWSDTFYPGNPERRERLIRKNQELLDLMKNNFRATNQLIETLKTHLGLSFSPIAMNEKATVKENCDVIIERIHEIQAELEKIDTHLKEKLEPTLYAKLKNMSLSDQDYHKVSEVVNKVCCVAGTVSVLAVSWLIKNGTILSNIKSVFGKIAGGCVANFGIGVLLMGVDMIISAILGSIERDQLEKALEEYEKALEEFRPASEEYQDSITYVRIKLKMA